MGFSRLKGILQSEVQRIDSYLFSDAIELRFYSKTDLRNSMSPHSTPNRLIGVNMVAFKEEIFESVGKHDEITSQGNHQRSSTIISAAIGNHLELLGPDGSILSHPGLELNMHGMSLSSAGEDFFTFINKLNGLACSRSKEGSAKILCIEVDLLTKSSSHFWLDHTDFTFRDVEGGRQISPEKKRNLSGRAQSELSRRVSPS